ncbi:helix-turn-helix transcriptional regulator [Nocardia farcinica]|nr:helix-turn-helix transcriptional regulator [Nocardia farcinica]MBF6362455.1 helix-turn-helix transcriptional regulator [Nocardia farcinica]MBF6386298.1 helix-turn-helix transcriptional regulator [Nocardia farcinica]MBF6540035.1 helix-turn-helix transcriptional regulator [Nocardia farcinica]
MGATPNTALRAARNARLMSQDDLARALRAAGCPSATKRLVQRWEAGHTVHPRPAHARALERVMGLPIETLGFGAVMAGRDLSGAQDGSHEVDSAIGEVAAEQRATSATRSRLPGNYAGVWLSRYEYYSSGRDATFTAAHHVVVLQHDDRLTVRSLPGSAHSAMEMDLTVDGHVATGTWSERTASDGYYGGARYHGAIQLLIELTGRRMAGKWVGFGKDFEINSGPWELVLRNPSTAKSVIDAYNLAPEQDWSVSGRGDESSGE